MKPDMIILVSTPSVLENKFLERLMRLQDVEVVMMLNDAPPSGVTEDFFSVRKAELSIEKVIKWHDDMGFCAQEEKSIQPTNPYFGKERWKRKRK